MDRGKRLTGSGVALAPRPRTKMETQSGNQAPEDSGKQRIIRDVEEGHKEWREQYRQTPGGCQGPGCRPRAAKGGERTRKDGR